MLGPSIHSFSFPLRCFSPQLLFPSSTFFDQNHSILGLGPKLWKEKYRENGIERENGGREWMEWTTIPPRGFIMENEK
jgi:hypothetical protein